MIVGISFILCSLMYLVLLCTAYFKKMRIETLETRIYDVLLILNVIGLILELACCFTVSKMDVIPITNFIVNRMYLIYFVSFITLFTLYIYIVCQNKEATNLSAFKKDSAKILFLIVYIVSIFFVSFLPLDYFYDSQAVYSYGPAANYLSFLSGMYLIFDLIHIIKNLKNLKGKKLIPLIALIICFCLAFLIRHYNPGIILITCSFTFVTAIMFFTIENPDVKMIEQLNIAREQAEKANNAKTDFLSNMSHEIRTPLNAIVGFSNTLMNNEELPEKAKEDVKYIISASDSLLDIVNGILDISKIEANKLEIVDTEYSINEVLDDLVALSKARLGEKPIEFKTNFDPSMPKYLYGDYSRIKQICINLLTNSIKYTKEGFIEFKVDYVKKGDICRLIISVEDSGIGIKKENIDKLFTKFERLDLEKNISIEGTGLGLAITKKLVELMHGSIVVQSEYGEGSKFTVAIDQRIVKEPTIEYKVELKEDLDLSNKKILIVDDNKLNLKVAEKVLEPYKVKTETLDSGTACIEKIKSGAKYDLILLDDMMPHKSGTQTLKELKEIEGFNTPVIALTANAITGMKEKYLKEGFNDYLAKPIEKNELHRVLSSLLK